MTTDNGGIRVLRLTVEDAGKGSTFLADADFALDALPEGWRLHLTVITGRDTSNARIVNLALGAAPRLKLPPLTSSVLRRIPLQRLVDQLVTELVERGHIRPLSIDSDEARALAAVFAERPRPGPKGRTDEDYMGIVSKYAWAMRDPATARAPVQAVARELHLSPKTVNNLIAEAKRRELIAGREPGKAGFEVTKKGLRTLERSVARKMQEQRGHEAKGQDDD